MSFLSSPPTWIVTTFYDVLISELFIFKNETAKSLLRDNDEGKERIVMLSFLLKQYTMQPCVSSTLDKKE
jgi:hypothetical protein